MLLNWYIGLIVRPVHTIQQIVDARPLGLGLLTLLIVAVLNGVISFGLGLDAETFETFTDEAISINLGFVIFATLLFVPFVAVQLGVFSGVVHLVSKLFGGQGAYTGILAGFMMLSILSVIPLVPALLDVLVTGIGEGSDGEESPFGAIGIVVSLVVSIWSIILGIVMIRENYRIGTGIAVMTGIVSFIAAFIVGIILFIVMFLLLVLIVVGLGIAVA